MYLDIQSPDGDVVIDLRDPYDFSSLFVRAPEYWSRSELAQQLSGTAAETGGVWLRTDRVRRWAARHVGDTWESGFVQLLEVLRQQARLSPDGNEVMVVVESRVP